MSLIELLDHNNLHEQKHNIPHLYQNLIFFKVGAILCYKFIHQHINSPIYINRLEHTHKTGYNLNEVLHTHKIWAKNMGRSSGFAYTKPHQGNIIT